MKLQKGDLVTYQGAEYIHHPLEVQSVGETMAMCVAESGDEHLLPLDSLTLYSSHGRWTDGDPVITDVRGMVKLADDEKEYNPSIRGFVESLTVDAFVGILLLVFTIGTLWFLKAMAE